MEITPTEFDVIVVGTGITECIVAAACSRIGKTVLHLDVNPFYGEQWSSFSLTGLERYIKDGQLESKSDSSTYEHFMRNLSLHDLSDKLIEKPPEEPEEQEVSEDTAVIKQPPKPIWTQEKFQKSKRRVNIDITPKVCYSAGAMVDLLRSSNCSRYLEFKAVNRSFVHHKGELIQAPCNREQVFNSKHLKVLEKRLMMKFVTFALQVDESSEEFAEWDKRDDIELYNSFKLTSSLVNLIKASLVVSTSPQVSAHHAIQSIKHYLRNVGVYGSMPFICPIYGAGELPQAFARFSAVFGSVYVLDMAVSEVLCGEEGDFSGVRMSGTEQVLAAKYCVLSPNYTCKELTRSLPDHNLVTVSHAVYLTDSSIKPKSKPNEQDDVSLIHILEGCMGNKVQVCGFEYGPRSCLPAEDMFMVHLMTPSASDDPKADLEVLTDKVTQSSTVLYKVFFTTRLSKEGSLQDLALSKNMIRTSFPTFNVSYTESITEARAAFTLLYPGEEFLPAAPEPEDIKWPEEEGEEGEEKEEEEEEKGKLGDEVEVTCDKEGSALGPSPS